MTKVQRWLVTAAALVVIGFGALFVLSAVQTARSPEAKCQQVMRDIERDRGSLSPSAWNAGYQGCMDVERGR